MSERRRVLVVTSDSVSTKMAGPAIRAFEMARVLSKTADVRLLSTVHASIEHPDFPIIDASRTGLEAAVAWAEIIVFQGHLLASYPWIRDTDAIIVADLYDPMHLEQLEQSKQLDPEDRFRGSTEVVEVLNQQILRADFMLCASEKQRDFWLGQLAGIGRINPLTYDADESLRSLLDVVPFGVGELEPVPTRHAIKGSVPGIAPDDKVVLWGGGIYNWFDPLTLVRAVHLLAARRPTVRLFFMGVAHPNPNVPTMRMAFRAQELARELGLWGTHVFFNEGWVPYEDRANFLCDADVGVSTHLDHLETAFSFRTRILDYLWAGLPIVSTDGDTFAELIREHGLGRVVPPNDVEALAEALERLLYDAEEASGTRERVRAFAGSMHWPVILEPLVRFCREGGRAPDLAAGVTLASRIHTDELTTRVRGLESSFSWRVTAPMRAVTGAAKRMVHRLRA